MYPTPYRSLYQLLFLSITISTTLPCFLCTFLDDPQYVNCTQPFECGNSGVLGDLKYPFWGINRASYCGKPGFKLSCLDNNTPVFNISTLDLRIIATNPQADKITVVFNDFWSNVCPSAVFNRENNTSAYKSVLSLNSGSLFTNSSIRFLTIFYSCHSDLGNQLGWLNSSSCSVNNKDVNVHFATQTVNVSLATKFCESVVSLPIPEEKVQALEERTVTLPKALDDGFDMNWLPLDDAKCRECVETGGQCGYNWTQTQFTCYCPDKPYQLYCPQLQRAMELYLLILLLSLTSLLPSPSSSSSNGKYEACSKDLQCGNLGNNVGFPFYDGSTRPNYCGYFKLTCQGLQQITISDNSYYVSNINVSDYTINVRREDTWAGSSCPDTLTNTTIDFSKYNFTSDYQNITFFYDCSSINDLSGLSLSTSCSNLGGNGITSGYYLTQKMVDDNKELNLLQNCNSNLYIPVPQSVAETIDSTPNLVTLIAAFRDGFELGLIADSVDECSKCTKSNGECGYDWDSNKFTCHCADKDYGIECGVDSSTTHNKKGSNKGILIGVSIGVVALVLVLLGAGYLFVRRRQKKQLVAQDKSRGVFPIPSSSNDGGGPHASTPGSNGLTSSHAYTSTPSTYSNSNASYMSSGSVIGKSYKYGVHVFDYTELEIATNNFDESKELGDGGFGTVYYGVLRDGRCVAVKRLYENSAKRKEQFENEIRLLADLEHKNLVRLYGCTSSRSRELLLVYEFIANGTVADHLHGKFSESTFLRWPARLNIAVETAEALAFLHRNTVIHRDVKTTNILLDDGFHVKVADFGLSREFQKDMTHVSTAPQGTPGYVDPEYYQCYRLTEKSDVYSFGVVLIELISSKQAVDITRHRHDVNLASMAVDRIQNQALHELVDPRLEFDKDHSVQAMVKMVAELGFQCLQPDREMRPTMDEVVARLRAVQLEGVKEQKQEVLDIIVYGDDVGLLTNPTPPLSPELPRSNDVV